MLMLVVKSSDEEAYIVVTEMHIKKSTEFKTRIEVFNDMVHD